MTRLKLTVLVLGALVLHQSVFASVRLADVRPEVMVLVGVAAGIVGGPERGAVIGFLCGLLADLFVQTPLGLSALSFGVVAFAVGAVQASVLRSAWWIPPLTAFVASAAGIALYALAGAIIGRSQFVRPQLLVTAVVVAAVNALLAPLAVRLMSWALAGGVESSYSY